MEFRLLRADEIEARAATIKSNGITLLLYKDARCDMNILDETVGPMNWERHHSRDNANCTVSIWDAEKEQWISKEDTGTESNTEKEKGLASDSFKRACFNWGIGRELYTAPFIFFPASTCSKIEQNGQRYICYDRFGVDEITYNGRKIATVTITNLKTKETLVFGTPARAQAEIAKAAAETIGAAKAKALEKMINDKGIDIAKIFERYGVTDLADLTEEQHARCVQGINRTGKKA